MEKNDQIRTHVRDAYAEAVTRQGTGCCGGGTKGVAVQWADYREDELRNLPEDAVINSFGCGNPLAYAGVYNGDTVLDLGSGAGIDLLIASKKVGKEGKVIGVDMTDEMILRARQNIREAGVENVEVRKGVIENLPVEDSSVDWVISNCVINLSPEKEKVFAEIFRILKPDGRISISDLVSEDLPDWVKTNQALYNTCIGGAISEKEYILGLQQAGLENIEVTDRLVYDASQIEGLIESETEGCGCGCAGEFPDSLIKGASEAIAGKVASLKFTGNKPG